MADVTTVPVSPIEPIAIKNPLSSKTLWLNAIMLVFTFIELLTPILEPYISHKVFAAITAVVALYNLILRFISTAKLMWSASLIKTPPVATPNTTV